MTRRTNARVAGFAFLIYIAAAWTGLILESRAAKGEAAAAKLASIAAHAGQYRAAILLVMVGCFCALVLAVTLYAITRDEDQDLALLAMICRVAEGVFGAVSLDRMVSSLSLATTAGAGAAPGPAAATALGAVLMEMPGDGVSINATFFAVGSTIFAWLLLRGRIIPVWLAWVGVFASVLIVVLLPLRAVRLVGGTLSMLMWLPMLVFEVVLAVWLIVKGAAVPARRHTA